MAVTEVRCFCETNGWQASVGRSSICDTMEGGEAPDNVTSIFGAIVDFIRFPITFLTGRTAAVAR